jgi:hypothetical protein
MQDFTFRRLAEMAFHANFRLLWGVADLVVRVPGYRTEMYCFLWGTSWIYICYVDESRPPLRSSGQSSWLHNGYVLCFLWGTNCISISYVEESRLPLWSSGQSSWLQVQRSGFDSRRYQIFWEVMGLERGPLTPVSTTEELLRRNSSGSDLENREYGSGDPLRWPRGSLYPQTFALTSPTSGARSVGIVRSCTQAMEIFVFFSGGWGIKKYIETPLTHVLQIFWRCRFPVSFPLNPAQQPRNCTDCSIINWGSCIIGNINT